jgi:hypothetical protein
MQVTYETADGIPPNGAAAGQDYTAANNPLTISKYQISATFKVTIAGDALVENKENLSLMLSNPVNALAGSMSATLYVHDAERRQDAGGDRRTPVHR